MYDSIKDFNSSSVYWQFIVFLPPSVSVRSGNVMSIDQYSFYFFQIGSTDNAMSVRTITERNISVFPENE